MASKSDTDPGSDSPADAYGEAYTLRQLERSRLRKLIRRLYLRRTVAQLHGPTIDFGCGIGELLARLPPGSVGLDVNPASVEVCRRAGLDARTYDAEQDGFQMMPLLARGDRFSSLVACHVIEHFPDPLCRLNSLLRAAAELGVTRAVVIVPGSKGFRSDPTHRSFVTREDLLSTPVMTGTDFTPVHASYFPLDVRWIGDVFTYHELMVVYAKSPRSTERP